MRKIFKLLKQAFTSENEDFTTLPINKAIALLAIPMMMEMVMESLFAIVDTFFVSNRLGTTAIATVGLTESMLTIVYSMGIGISMAGTAIVARRVGEKEYDKAGFAGAQTITLGVGVSIVIGIIGVLFPKQLLDLMGASENTIAQGYRYTQIMIGSNTVIMLLFLINGIFRGIGNASIAFKSLLISNFFNIIFCPLFIILFDWGLEGAALATVCGRGLGVLYQLTQLSKKSNLVKIKLENYLPNKIQLKAILDIAGTATLQFLIASGSWIVLVIIVSQYGESATAGYTIFVRILLFFLMPAWGISNAASTLVGQNLGAQKPDRAEKSVWQTAKVNAIYMGLVTLICLIFGSQIVDFFTNKAEDARIATKALGIVSIGFIVYGVGMVLLNSFNGAGDSKTPTIVNFVGYWLFQIPFAYLLCKILKFEINGVFYAIIITETFVLLLSLYMFKKGKWKSKQV